jgi:hypothetical protein
MILCNAFWLICVPSVSCRGQFDFHVVTLIPPRGFFFFFQMIYVLCVYNQKEKEHQITVCSKASAMMRRRNSSWFIYILIKSRKIQSTDGCLRH